MILENGIGVLSEADACVRRVDPLGSVPSVPASKALPRVSETTVRDARSGTLMPPYGRATVLSRHTAFGSPEAFQHTRRGCLMCAATSQRITSATPDLQMASPPASRMTTILHPSRRFLAAVLSAGLGTFALMAPTPAQAKPMAEKMGERIARGALDESLETLDRKENRERLGRIMNSPQIRTAMHDITESIVLGVVHGMRKGMKEAGGPNIDVAKSVGDGINQHIAPAAARMTGRLVDAALTASLADKHIAQIEKLAQGATHAVLAGVASGMRDELGPAMAATLDKDLGPAIAVMIERDIMPAVGRGLDSPEMQSGIANLTRSVATELIGGADDALVAEREEKEANGEESGLQVFGGNVAIGYAIALFVAFAFGTLLVVLTVLLVRSNRRQHRQYEEAKQREATLMHLLDSVDADHPELKTDVQRLVRSQVHSTP
ncbi:MAG: hypothetical protein IAG13_30465 [Deltaproteobacteria bacterium]|nr:hypothetical protein [Nannocystaceae bacterium]